MMTARPEVSRTRGALAARRRAATGRLRAAAARLRAAAVPLGAAAALLWGAAVPGAGLAAPAGTGPSTAPAATAAGMPLDLLQAWHAAEQNDAAFAAAKAQREAGDTKRRQGTALLLPQVALSGSAGYLDLDRDTTGAQFSAPGFGSSSDAEFRTRISNGQSAGVALSARQPLYSPERAAGRRQLDRQAQLADAQYHEAQQSLILRTAQAYFDVLVAADALGAASAQKAAATRAWQEASERFAAGAEPVTGRYEAQARKDEAEVRELALKNELSVRRALLEDVTGQPGAGLAALSSRVDMSRIAAGSLNDWSARAAAGNPAIAIVALTQDIARDEIEKFKALAAPSLDLVAQVADDRMQGSSGFGTTAHITSNARSIGLQLSIPLFTGGMRSARHDEAVALADKARWDAAATAQAVRREVLAAWLAVTTGLDQVRANEAALESSRLRLDATAIGREAGARSTIDLMNAQADFYASRHRLAEARYQLVLSRLRLTAAAGELAEGEVSAVNGLLSPPEAP